MKKLFIRYILIISLLVLSSASHSQKNISCDTVMTHDSVDHILILSFTPVYSSNIIEFSGTKGEDELFLLKPHSFLTNDSLLSALSKKEFTSRNGITETLKQHYEVYPIDIGNTRKTSALDNQNNYRKAYLFFLSAKMKKNNAVVGYLLTRYTLKSKIAYCIKYDDLNDVNSVSANIQFIK